MTINSYVKSKVLWFPDETSSGVELNSIININGTKNDSPTNNKLSIELLDVDDLYENDTFKILENDTIITYVKTISDQTSSTDFTSDDALWTGKFLDYSKSITPDKKTVSIKVTDWEYDIFNRFHTKSYNGLGLRTPFVISDMIRELSEKYDGSEGYNVEIKYVGYPRTDGIQVTRKNGGDQSSIEFTDSDVTNNTTAYQAYTALDDAYKFPEIEPIMLQKPAYEWVKQLGSPAWTNTDTEISTSAHIILKQMVFGIRGTLAVWYYPDPTEVITVDSDTTINSLTSSTGNERSVNFLTIECGEDLNGEPIFTFIVDETNTSPVTKEKYDGQFSIAGKNTTYENSANELRIQYAGNNSGFITAVKKLAKSYSEYWFQEFGKARKEASLTMPYQALNPGDLVTFDLDKFPIENFRIKSSNFSLSSKGFTTTLSLEEELDNI